MAASTTEFPRTVALPGGLPLPTVSEALRAAGALAAANARFAETLSAAASEAEAFTQFGLRLFKEQRMDEAAALFRLALALSPDNPVLWTNWGTALDGSGAFAEAAACLERSLELLPQQPDTWLLLGLVKKKRGDLPGCEAAYRHALVQAPNSSAAWQCLGLLKNEQKNYAEAVASFQSALTLGPANAALLANLGKLYYQLGRFLEASDAYRDALALDPENGHYRHLSRKANFVRDMIDGLSVDASLAHCDSSADLAEQKSDERRQALLRAAFGQLSGFGHAPAAKRVGEKYLELWPNSPVLKYLMRALDGDPAVDRSPSDYLSEYFDSFAAGFDEKLVDVLGYDIPQKMCAAIKAASPSDHQYDAADIGCGTGLCGPLLRPFARTLIGVDISSNMLAQAKQRGVYDELTCEEVTAFLDRFTPHFDLVVAADVMVYIGDLRAVFSAAAKAIRPGGLFAFSTESLAETGYRLQPSGRFVHAPQYVRSLAAAGFAEQEYIETTIRLEAGTRVPGNIFLFRRNAPGLVSTR